MSSQRPVYIPRRRKAPAASNGCNANNNPVESAGKRPFQKRQKQLQPRFHGAFTGGFSAGHFNTVGTKEGWTPSQNKIRDQKLEDFMDEEDHADWGGPTRLREAYEHKVGTTASNPSNADADRNVDGDGDGPNSGGTIYKNPIGSFLPLQSMLEISHQTVGPRLLRRLGWREGGTAIVPENTTRAVPQSSAKENDGGDLARVHLSKRRLRKIQLQSSRITKLPPPKLDQCGLGFEPYKDAPEFQRYREQRRQQAKDRASYDTSTKGRNVYRLSDVASGSETTAGAANANAATANAATANASRSKSRDAATTGNSDYLSFETAEDFVGKRSAAGFALRDDEDDAYDNERPRNNRRGGSIEVGEEYNTEVYEHVDSDDDDDNDAHDASSALPAHRAGGGSHSRGVTNQRAVRTGDIFAAWAGTDPHSSKGTQASASNASRSMPATKTLDGKIPLAGFVVGDSVDTSQKRYAGPDIPRNYAIQRHEFGEHENPYVLEAISNAVRLEQTEERNFRARQQQLQLQQESQRQLQGQSAKPDRPLTKNFSSLADAMKSRFTPAAPELSKQQGGSAHTEQTSSFPAGLHLPNPVQTKTGSSESAGPPLPPSHTPEIVIQRTVRSFVPNPLVCKRFRVPVPSHARASSALASAKSANYNNNNNNNNTMDHNKSRESVYFEREILQKAKEEFQTKNRPELAVEKDPEANASTAQESSGDDGEEDRKGLLDRPSIERLRSIFEASSDESSSSDDEDEDGMEEEGEGKNANANDSSRSAKGDKNSSKNASTEKANESSRAIVVYQHASSSSPSSSLARKGENRDGSLSTSSRDDNDDDDSSSRGRRRRRKKRRRKHDRHRRKQKRKRSRSTDRDRDRDRYRDRDYHCCSSDDDDEKDDEKDDKRGKEKERRRKRDKRTKKKKSSSYSSSSRHRSRKREKTEER
mmetsp:Transcript_22157/g.61654  ORF Transcript_22157/g.61654 Transcript_22157/m.61654 type:complete len:931 (-) Transcript_22157:443-3235(-)